MKKSGVAGMVIGGSMGEGAGMSAEELAEAVRVTIEATDGTLHVFGGIIADTSKEGVRLAKAVAAAGAAGFRFLLRIFILPAILTFWLSTMDR